MFYVPLFCLPPIVFLLDTILFHRKIGRHRLLANPKEFFISRTVLLGIISIVASLAQLMVVSVALLAVSLTLTLYFYVSYNTYRVLDIASFLRNILCSKKGCRIHLGFFFATTTIRNYTLFCFHRGDIYLIIKTEGGDTNRGAFFTSFLKRYLQGKIIEKIDLNGTSIIVTHGRALIYDPESHRWQIIKGKISSVVFRHSGLFE